MTDCGPKNCKQFCYQFVTENLLVILTLLAVIVGIIVGISVRQINPSQDVIIWIGLLGEVYMRMLKMMILPLIICSVISGTASLDPKCNGRVSLISLTFIIVSNSLSCVVPIVLALSLKPGDGMNLQSGVIDSKANTEIETSDIFVDLIRNLFPENIFTACFQQVHTIYTTKTLSLKLNETLDDNKTTSFQPINSTFTVRTKSVGTVSSTNVLGLVICCLIFGVASSSTGNIGKPFIVFFNSANEIILKILRWFVWTTPLGVSSLIAVAFLQTSDLESAVRSLGMFSLCVLTALAIHQFVLLPAIYLVLIKENPYKFLWTLGGPWLVTFAAASSAVAIPETLMALEKRNKIDKRITRFVVPFATTINRDGSCVFIATSCIFIAQLVGAELHAGRIALMWILTTVISVAIPSVPSAGVVAVVINLTALGIPVDLVGLLFAAEWILDRFRSGTNMISHAHCAMVTYRYCQKYLPAQDNGIELEISEPMLKS
ncbi:excitatory amino acid transporter 2-like isoform X1 [Biomphalaria glabrata]|uniref:Amino acid transporter n=1 Tax=Biomphalaria glabrata TaxID=6526 RepID=A0A9W3BJZ0_BIOGL|nr:excitatory amino acid transporter 2-like isoform X1 [Biomphalaria glabrata]XP_055899750.1 excitatory amino acid transporter 2-like isoform X1 [Biomphalaria glabrata]